MMMTIYGKRYFFELLLGNTTCESIFDISHSFDIAISIVDIVFLRIIICPVTKVYEFVVMVYV